MRESGILLPIFSLPGKYGIGCFGEEAYKFVDFLYAAGQRYWQILPLGPTSYGDSPYQSFSTFAGNPYFIDLEKLRKEGLLTDEECEWTNFGGSPETIDYGIMYKNRFKLLRAAFSRVNLSDNKAYHEFITENADWVNDYAKYMAIKNSFDDVSLMEWPDDIRLRTPEAMEKYEKELADDIAFYLYLQYEFYAEWHELKAYANQHGIKIIGDIPIYVSLDSADVWANPNLFELDKDGHPTAVAGCPPDGFSADGQLWGNPLYKWDVHKKTGYAWWLKRMQKSEELYDVIRIDHFRGFDEYYTIPAKDKTARNGKWVKGPGFDLFEHMKKELKDVEIIAEDLGYMTDSVRKLVKDTGYPNMKVLQFAFDSRDTGAANDYLPHNYSPNCVCYTGTHDNDTTLGWLSAIKPEELEMVADYVDGEAMDKEELVRKLVRFVHMSPANMAIIPMQDYLILDSKARINTPSTLGKNWQWRMREGVITMAMAKRIYKLTRLYGRAPEWKLEEERVEREAAAKAEAERKRALMERASARKVTDNKDDN